MEPPSRPLTPDEEHHLLCNFLRSGTARTLRDLAGLSVDQLAACVGVEPEVVQAWEEARVYPQQPYAVRKYLAVLRELCVTPSDCR